MITVPTRRAALRATLPLAALLLTGCSAYFGPAATRDGMSRLQPLLTPEDGALEFSTAASWWNLRLQPTLGQALLLGARNDPVMGVVAVTERSLIGATWTGETRGYVVSFRIPYREIVALRQFGVTTNIFGNRTGAFEVETNVPRHVPLGEPSRTGLFRVTPDGTEVLDTLRSRAPQAGNNPE
ncbi:hypothetical protein KTR66_19590 [Roseococcus sp. SDR]|uniref:hypothetical protein n=1 Tax=Roseococcus sp. SDR TaxID=2835532 RepID=UPI001BCD13D2|nr:hypothetical protein [Roseococcus sp. SDR]MBS7792211.1 hypothetical protein [Roseococcus sp. SDR]MBV1847525.1 hypothetical protein [Roseococcus sp. SDR]